MPKPKNKDTVLYIRKVDPDLKRKFKATTAAEGESMKDAVERMMANYIEEVNFHRKLEKLERMENELP